MASAVTELLIALREWQKAVKQLKHQGKSPQERQQQLEVASQKVLEKLAITAVEEEINDLIQSSTSSEPASVKLRLLLRRHPEPFLSAELESIYPMGISHTTLQKVIAEYLKAPDPEPSLDSSQQILKLFARMNSVALAEHQASIALSRKPKKRRRRDLSLGTLQTAIGIGLVAGNTQMDSTVANSSYILGGNALLTALQNFVGRVEDERGDGAK
ncbi:MAG: hypothetical protein AAGF98_14350 [Cyanobacteria bacterium P01_H01_bin.153]